jgi:hypothetical protein
MVLSLALRVQYIPLSVLYKEALVPNTEGASATLQLKTEDSDQSAGVGIPCRSNRDELKMHEKYVRGCVG